MSTAAHKSATELAECSRITRDREYESQKSLERRMWVDAEREPRDMEMEILITLRLHNQAAYREYCEALRRHDLEQNEARLELISRTLSKVVIFARSAAMEEHDRQRARTKASETNDVGRTRP